MHMQARTVSCQIMLVFFLFDHFEVVRMWIITKCIPGKKTNVNQSKTIAPIYTCMHIVCIF